MHPDTQPPPLPSADPHPVAVLPYAVPVAYEESPAWQDGPLLVVRKGASVAHACVKCGGPADGGPIKRTYYWHSPWIYLVILANLLIYALVALIVRQKGTVYLALCATHRRRRRRLLALAWLLGLGGVALMAAAFLPGGRDDIASGGDATGWMFLAALMSLAAGLLLGLRSQILTARRIDAHFVWLKGAGPAFLATLPGVVRQ